MMLSFFFIILISLRMKPTSSTTATNKKKRPNLLFLMTDQQRYNTISRFSSSSSSSSSSSFPHTPNLDKLSHSGAYFPSTYTHCAVCTPARTSLLTGHTIEHTGVRDNWLSKEANDDVSGNDASYKLPPLLTFDEILVHDFGYVAEYYGKWHSPECKGRVYDNDLRMAGAVESWFGKYEEDGSKHMSLGMKRDYQEWLDKKMGKGRNLMKPKSGEQCNSLSGRTYVPDGLDSRFGKEPTPNVCKSAMEEQQEESESMESFVKSLLRKDNTILQDQVDHEHDHDLYHDYDDTDYDHHEEVQYLDHNHNHNHNHNHDHNHNHANGGIDEHGMDLLPENLSLTAKEGNEALSALHRLHTNSSQPFSLTISFHSPHPPMVPTHKYYHMYPPSLIPLSPSFHDPQMHTNSAYSQRTPPPNSPYRNATLVRRWMSSYYGHITEVDEWIGKILDKLDELNIADETMVIFTSDHGEMLGSHDGMRGKSVFYEESARVPLMIRFPGRIEKGVVVEDAISHLDLHSTILDYLGARNEKKEYETDGKSLRRFIENQNLDEESFVLTQWNMTDSTHDNRPTQDPAFMIRKGHHKLIMPDTAHSTKVDMMFDLYHDPHEMNNLVGRKKRGMDASHVVIGKAEHLKCLLVRRLEELGQVDSAKEMKRRRTWKALHFWISDDVLTFRDAVLVDHQGGLGNNGGGMVRKEWLYMGSATNNGVQIHNITITGGTSHANYELDWVTNDIPGHATKILTVTFKALQNNDNSLLCSHQPSTSAGAANARLIIEFTMTNDPHKQIKRRRIALVPPSNVLQCNDSLLSKQQI